MGGLDLSRVGAAHLRHQLRLARALPLTQGERHMRRTALDRGAALDGVSHLWKAASAPDFGLAWREQRHFEVRNLDLTEVLRHAGHKDVEPFGRLFMVLLHGVDETREWFSRRCSAANRQE